MKSSKFKNLLIYYIIPVLIMLICLQFSFYLIIYVILAAMVLSVFPPSIRLYTVIQENKLSDIDNLQERLETLDLKRKKISVKTYYYIKAATYLGMGNYTQARAANQLYLEQIQKMRRNNKRRFIHSVIFYQIECFICLYLEEFDNLRELLLSLEATYASIKSTEVNCIFKDCEYIFRTKLALLDNDLESAAAYLEQISSSMNLIDIQVLKIELDYRSGKHEASLLAITEVIETASCPVDKEVAEKLKDYILKDNLLKPEP